MSISWLWYCSIDMQYVILPLGETGWRVWRISLYYLLQLHVNLQLSQKKKKRVKGNWYSNGEANQLFGLGFICKDVHYNAVYSSKILHKLPKCLKTRNSFIIKIMVFFKINLFILFIYFWLHWVFTAVRGLSLVAVSRGYSSLWYAVFTLLWVGFL